MELGKLLWAFAYESKQLQAVEAHLLASWELAEALKRAASSHFKARRMDAMFREVQMGLDARTKLCLLLIQVCHIFELS